MADEQDADQLLYKTAPSRIILVHIYLLVLLLAGLSTTLSLRLVDLGLPDLAGRDLDLVLSLAAGLLAFLLFLYGELKRILRRYLVFEHRVARREGILSKRIQYMPYSKVERVELIQPFVKRILGIGDILVDTGEDQILLEAVRNPSKVEGLLAERLRREADRRMQTTP